MNNKSVISQTGNLNEIIRTRDVNRTAYAAVRGRAARKPRKFLTCFFRRRDADAGQLGTKVCSLKIEATNELIKWSCTNSKVQYWYIWNRGSWAPATWKVAALPLFGKKEAALPLIATQIKK